MSPTPLSIPVEVAAKVADNIVGRALSTREFRTPEGHIRWGAVEEAFLAEMTAAANGETSPWDGALEPWKERKLRLIDSRFRDWPEPARSEALSILANGCLPDGRS